MQQFTGNILANSVTNWFISDVISQRHKTAHMYVIFKVLRIQIAVVQIVKYSVSH